MTNRKRTLDRVSRKMWSFALKKTVKEQAFTSHEMLQDKLALLENKVMMLEQNLASIVMAKKKWRENNNSSSFKTTTSKKRLCYACKKSGHETTQCSLSKTSHRNKRKEKILLMSIDKKLF